MWETNAECMEGIDSQWKWFPTSIWDICTGIETQTLSAVGTKVSFAIHLWAGVRTIPTKNNRTLPSGIVVAPTGISLSPVAGSTGVNEL